MITRLVPKSYNPARKFANLRPRTGKSHHRSAPDTTDAAPGNRFMHSERLGKGAPCGRTIAGGRPTLKTMKTASRTLKGGRDVVELSGRGRPARGASGKRKTSENSNVFGNLAPAMDSTSGGAASCRAMADGGREGKRRQKLSIFQAGLFFGTNGTGEGQMPWKPRVRTGVSSGV